MASKRPLTDLIPNPFIKRRNLNWTLDPPDSKSPPKPRDDGLEPGPDDCPAQQTQQQQDQPTTSAVESGQVQIANHLLHFTSLLACKALDSPFRPLLPIASYVSLYQSHAGTARGSHFVIHQHDHPIAGTHYDLRLQINPTSSVSWAIMYGPPGDPNSSRPNRNATETRIHSLWNHLVETASPHTGSLLIWDTGTYAVLPRRSKHDSLVDPASQRSALSSSSSSSSLRGHESQQALLATAFSNRKIRLRLHGSKLPHNYVLNLRLTKTDDQDGRAKNATNPPRRRRRRRDQERAVGHDNSDRDDDDNGGGEKDLAPKGRDVPRGISSSAERELQELEDAEVVRTNAYPGATNSIGSIHQRKWYLSLDREASGFVARRAKTGKVVWESAADEDADLGADTDTDKAGIHQEKNTQTLQRLSFPFYVRGVECERSVVTGRRGGDLLRDEGVDKFKSRKGWKPVLI